MIGLLLSVEPPPATLARPAIFTTHGGDGGIVGQNHMMSIVQSIDLDDDNTITAITNIVTYEVLSNKSSGSPLQASGGNQLPSSGES